MSREAKWFQKLLKKAEKDPEAITYRLLYMITDDICRAMEKQGMTRRELAERLGVKPQYVSRFLNTPTNTSLYQVVRFAQAVGLKLEYTRLEESATTTGVRVALHAAEAGEKSDDWETAGQPWLLHFDTEGLQRRLPHKDDGTNASATAA